MVTSVSCIDDEKDDDEDADPAVFIQFYETDIHNICGLQSSPVVQRATEVDTIVDFKKYIDQIIMGHACRHSRVSLPNGSPAFGVYHRLKPSELADAMAVLSTLGQWGSDARAGGWTAGKFFQVNVVGTGLRRLHVSPLIIGPFQ